MNLYAIGDRHTRGSKIIERRMKRRMKWILRFPKSKYANYLKGLIVEDRELLDAALSAFAKNLKRRRRDLERMLAGDLPDKKRRKLREEYNDIIEIMYIPNIES